MRKLPLIIAFGSALLSLPVHAQTPTGVGAMSISEAYRVLREAIPLDGDMRKDASSSFRISENNIVINVNSTVLQFRFRDTPNPTFEECGIFSNCSGQVRVLTKGTGPKARANCCNWWWVVAQRNVAERFVLAFKTLGIGVPPETAAETEAFKVTVDQYRAATPKPEFPEEARRARVQAESALRDKRLDDAIDRYEEALKIAAWWPEGRFNRALILGDLERYTEAMREMKRYLALVPDAPNARAAQDKIYEWEDKVKL